MAGNERIFATDFMTKRARELGLTKSTFGNSNGLPDPANKMTVRELAKLARQLVGRVAEWFKAPVLKFGNGRPSPFCSVSKRP
jgi:D-alanyl-D-alanine carboxypeptidase (penicillin-binding protein 5/6)